jgi:dTDP-4-amino-4,6-dideoxygalactose transaminase
MDTMTATRDIPFFNYKGTFAAIEPELTATFRDVLSRGAFIMQKDLREFEEACAEYLHVKHAFGVGNATDGLHISLRAAGIQPGDEVLVSAHTMIATPAAIHFAGGVSIPVDIGPDHMMDAAALEPAITKKTRFIMPVQVNGRTCDMDAIGAVARKHDLSIVEDAAQALGSRFKGKLAGTFGVASAFSFYPAKVLGCLGDGGLVVTDHDAVADKVHGLRDHGRDREGDVAGWGMNSRLDNLQAAFLHLQLRKYQAVIDHRRAIAKAYHEELGSLAEVVLPPGPDADARHFDVYQNFELEAERRDALQSHLKAKGVGTLVQWSGRAIHQHPKLGLRAAHVPVTDKFFTRCLMVPMNLLVTRSDVAYIAEVIRGFYGK